MLSIKTASTGRKSRRLLQIAAIALLNVSYASIATAQTAPPPVDTQDENGIELFTLNSTSLRSQSDDLSIGSGAFPTRLYVKRNSYSSIMFGRGSNLDVNIVTAYSGNSLQNETNAIYLNIGASRRLFTSADGGVKFFPQDMGEGYLRKTVESGVTVYTYYSGGGDALRFQVTNGSVCGRSSTTSSAVQFIICSKIQNWTAPNGVRADFNYYVRSDEFGWSGETDLTSVTNTLGLSLNFTYSRFKDNGKYSAPAYAVTSAVASSNQLGVCSGQASCSRTASYQYTTNPAWDIYVLGSRTDIDLNQVTDTLGGVTQFVSGGIRRPAHPTTNFVSLSGGGTYTQPTLQLTDSQGNQWNYARTVNSSSGDVQITRTDPQSHTRIYNFDSSGNLRRFQNEAGEVTVQDFNGRHVIQANLPDGRIIYRSYVRDNVATETIKAYPAGSAPDIVTSSNYGEDCSTGNPKTCNQPSWTQDAKGNKTYYTYDPNHGGVLTVTRPAASSGGIAPQMQFTYGTVSGAYALTGASLCRTTASCAGTADETKLTLGYGANGLRPTSVTVQSGDGLVQSTQGMTYDAFGNVVSQDGPLPGSADTVTSRYDRKGRLTGTTAPDPDASGPLGRAATRTSYDADDNVVSVEQGVVAGTSDTDWAAFNSRETVASAYDTGDRKISDTVSANGTVYAKQQYSYDTLGNVDCQAVRMNSAAWGTLPASACTPQTAGSAGSDRITKYAYDSLSRQTKVTSGYGTAAPIDDLTQTYNSSGKVATQTDARGNVTSYGYDNYARLATTTYPGGSTEQVSYDPNGNVTSRTLRDGTSIAFTYDNLDRVTTKTPPAGEAAASFSYDLTGNVLTATQGTTVSYAWDALGRKTSETQPYGTLSYQYDAAGKTTRKTWQDGFYTSYTYDDAGHMTAIKENGSATLASFGYDDLGRRTSLTRGNGVTTSYSFDPVSHLSGLTADLSGTVSDQSVALSYNPAGQIVSATRSNPAYAYDAYPPVTVNRAYVSNALNQYNSAGTKSFTYDARGNLATSDGVTYAYTSENRLKTATGGIALAYDPAGRLVQYDVAAASTRMMYDGDHLAAEITNPSGSIARRYVFGPDGDEPLVEYDASGTKTYLVADERGSIIARTDASGLAMVKNSYDEQGIPGLSNIGLFQYTGQAWLNDLGMSYYKARIYSPALGRFLQTDPIGYADGMNWYRYAGNDPVNNSDPSGLQSQCDATCQNLIYGTYNGPVFGNGGGSSGPPWANYGPPLDFGPRSTFLPGPKVPPLTGSVITASTTPPQRQSTPWYNNKCVTDALWDGGKNLAVDAIGFIPESRVAVRLIGRNMGRYRGIVADQYGKRISTAVAKTMGFENGAIGFRGDDWTSWVSAGITVLDFIPVVSQFTATAAVIWDTGVMAYKVYQCPK